MNIVTHFQVMRAVRITSTTIRTTLKTRPLKVHQGPVRLKPILARTITNIDFEGALYWRNLMTQNMSSQKLSYM
jgi:hypothetical protein